MPKFLTRIVVLLLVSCISVNPSLAAGQFQQFFVLQSALGSDRFSKHSFHLGPNCFEEQALEFPLGAAPRFWNFLSLFRQWRTLRPANVLVSPPNPEKRRSDQNIRRAQIFHLLLTAFAPKITDEDRLIHIEHMQKEWKRGIGIPWRSLIVAFAFGFSSAATFLLYDFFSRPHHMAFSRVTLVIVLGSAVIGVLGSVVVYILALTKRFSQSDIEWLTFVSGVGYLKKNHAIQTGDIVWSAKLLEEAQSKMSALGKVPNDWKRLEHLVKEVIRDSNNRASAFKLTQEILRHPADSSFLAKFHQLQRTQKGDHTDKWGRLNFSRQERWVGVALALFLDYFNDNHNDQALPWDDSWTFLRALANGKDPIRALERVRTQLGRVQIPGIIPIEAESDSDKAKVDLAMSKVLPHIPARHMRSIPGVFAYSGTFNLSTGLHLLAHSFGFRRGWIILNTHPSAKFSAGVKLPIPPLQHTMAQKIGELIYLRDAQARKLWKEHFGGELDTKQEFGKIYFKYALQRIELTGQLAQDQILSKEFAVMKQIFDFAVRDGSNEDKPSQLDSPIPPQFPQRAMPHFFQRNVVTAA